MAEPMDVDSTAQAKDKSAEKKKEEAPVDLSVITFESIVQIKNQTFYLDLKEWCNQLERGDIHIVGRVLQFLNRTRKQLNTDVLVKLCNTYLYSSPAQKKLLLSWLPAKTRYFNSKFSTFFSNDTAMEVDVKTAASKTPTSTPSQKKQQILARKAIATPELELYVHLLVLLFLTDEKKYDLALLCAKNYIENAEKHDKRSLDPFIAKGYFYLSLISERTGKTGTLLP